MVKHMLVSETKHTNLKRYNIAASNNFFHILTFVALSRATELKLLTLRGFSAKAFRAHPKVKVIIFDIYRDNVCFGTNPHCFICFLSL